MSGIQLTWLYCVGSVYQQIQILIMIYLMVSNFNVQPDVMIRKPVVKIDEWRAVVSI